MTVELGTDAGAGTPTPVVEEPRSASVESISAELRAFTSRGDWLAARRHLIGGSDVAKIVGIAPETWGSPLSVWMTKTGVVPIVDDPTPWQEWGHRHEPAIAQAWAEENLGPDDAILNPAGVDAEAMFVRDGWKAATPDRFAVVDGELVCVELKTVTEWLSSDWDDGPPDYYRAQCLWYAHVLGVARVDIAVLVGLSDFRVHTIDATDPTNQELTEWLVDAVSTWRQTHLVEGAEPQPTMSSDKDLVARRYPTSTTATVDLSEEALEDLRTVISLNKRIKELATSLDVVKARVQSALGDAEEGRFGGATVVTWKSASPTDPLKRRAILQAEIDQIDAGEWVAKSSRRFLPKAGKVEEVA